MAIILDTITLKIKPFWIPEEFQCEKTDKEKNKYGKILEPILLESNISPAWDRNGCLHLSFSVSRMAGKDNTNRTTVAKRDFKNACEKVQNALFQAGFAFDIWNCCDITRLDIARDAHLIHPFEQYKPFFRMIHFPHSKNVVEYKTSIYVGNKSHKIVFYDKSKKEGIGGNLYRFEYRIQRQAKIEKLLEFIRPDHENHNEPEFSPLVHLKSDFHRLEEIYNQQIKSLLGENNLAFEHDYSILEYIKDNKCRPALIYFIAVQHIDQIIEKYGTIDNFLCMFSGLYSKSAISKMRKTFQNLLSVHADKSNSSFSGRMAELRKKYLG